MNSQLMTKKILRIRRGEYLLAISPEGVATTYDKDKAMDITNWSLEQLAYIISNLKRVGYKKTVVETVEIIKREDFLARVDEKIQTLLNKEGYERLEKDPALKESKKNLRNMVEKTAKPDQ